MTSMPSTRRPSSTADGATTTRPIRRPASAATIGRMPGTGRTSPSEAELAEEGDRERPGTHLLGAQQDPDGDGQIERRARLAQLRRRKVDRDAARREGEPGVPDRAADALTRFLHGRVAQADDREAWQAGRDVDLDADRPAVETVQRGGRDDGQHAGTLPAAAHP